MRNETQDAGDAALIEDFRVYADAIARTYADRLVGALEKELRSTTKALQGTQREMHQSSQEVLYRLATVTADVREESDKLKTRLQQSTAAFEQSAAAIRERVIGVAEEFRQELARHAEEVGATYVESVISARRELELQRTSQRQALVAMKDEVNNQLLTVSQQLGRGMKVVYGLLGLQLVILVAVALRGVVW